MALTTTNSGITQAAYNSICSAIGDRDIIVDQISAGTEVVIDQTDKFLITSSLGKKYFLIVSNPKFPLTVSDAISRLQDARSILGSRTQNVVEMPIHYGYWEGVSYALWLYSRPLSKNRFYLYAQKRLLIPKMANWLSSVAEETIQKDLTFEDLRNNFIEPLEILIAQPELGATLSRVGQIAIRRITAGDFRPVHVLQHGDLWRGNVLIEGPMELLNPLGDGFIVIDWGGARVSGYPFIDLLRFVMSFNLSPKKTAHHMNSMRNIIRCEPEDVVSYVVCSFGKLYQELNNFPRQNFINLCESAIRHLVAAGLCKNY